jgi:copper chaperone
MKTETIYIANLKCGGCASKITKELSEIAGVSNVKVDTDTDSVDVTYPESLERSEIIHKLHHLGYPEATEENGLLL